MDSQEEKKFREGLYLAQHGDVAYQYYVGGYYLYGQGCQKDVGEALRWYDIAISNGRQDACVAKANVYLLAQLYLQRQPTDEDISHGIEILEDGVARGFGLAACTLGELYAQFCTEWVSPPLAVADYDKAKSWFEKSLDMHFDESYNRGKAYAGAAQLYFDGLGVPKDYGKALGLLIDAFCGDCHFEEMWKMMEHMFSVGGYGVERNAELAEICKNRNGLEFRRLLRLKVNGI